MVDKLPSTDPLSKLNMNVIGLVLSNFKLKTLLELRLVSKHWKRVAQEYIATTYKPSE